MLIPSTHSAAYCIPGIIRPYMLNDKKNTIGAIRMFSKKNVCSAVCEYYGRPLEVICGRSQKRTHLKPRQILSYILKVFTEMTHKSIGEMYGKDHTTSMHSVLVVKELLEAKHENEYKDDYKAIIELIKSKTNGKG